MNIVARALRKLRKLLGLLPEHRLIHVESPIEPDRYFEGPHGHELYASGFNMAWFDQLGIYPKLVLDVGSYDGGDALSFKQHFPDATVITIEADPDRAQFVREAVDNTGIEVIEAAVSDRAESLSFYRTSINGKSSSQGSLFKLTTRARRDLPHIVQADLPTTVKSQRLDDILLQRQLLAPDLLHMDIQGGEYDALVSLGKLRPKAIYLEVDAQYDGIRGARHIHKMMTRMGYTLAADLVTDRLYVRSDVLMNQPLAKSSSE